MVSYNERKMTILMGGDRKVLRCCQVFAAKQKITKSMDWT
ncbi:hypothetical protein COO91_08740 [Nostoc flagelliforme CCNUN1]|uniref:Uncharacterized protein n=1 Tax=Nostoc flagelliforme CCNUN1 TaxID=2038116 RepID=A0A2K8T4F1_9NOSO|nr:hypothetical protein COO91_08740 [Nostoc flagelliforme CCNUN1]